MRIFVTREMVLIVTREMVLIKTRNGFDRLFEGENRLGYSKPKLLRMFWVYAPASQDARFRQEVRGAGAFFLKGTPCRRAGVSLRFFRARFRPA